MAGTDDLAVLAAAVGLDPPEFRRVDVEEQVGVPHADLVRWWRAMGFAEVPEDEPAFGAEDVLIATRLVEFVASGRVDDRDVLRLARVLGASFSRIAEAQVSMLEDASRPGGDATPDEDADAVVHDAELLALLERALVYVWRRHLLAAFGRRLRVDDGAPSPEPSADSGPDGPSDAGDASGPDDASGPTGGSAASDGEGDAADGSADVDDGASDATSTTVGFVDIAGFSSLSRRLDVDELTDLVDGFEAAALEAVADHDGRVIKFIGDAVMYVAPNLDAGVRVGLDLQELAAVAELPVDLHCGVAVGPTLTMGGDVFGPTVNLASRLTDVARRGTVVITRDSAAALRDDPSLDVRNVRRLYDLKGIGRTRLATVARAGVEVPTRRRRS